MGVVVDSQWLNVPATNTETGLGSWNSSVTSITDTGGSLRLGWRFFLVGLVLVMWGARLLMMNQPSTQPHGGPLSLMDGGFSFNLIPSPTWIS